MSNELTPETRRERYYDAMLGGDDMPADPHTREERYLEAIVEAIEAGSSDEKIQEAVDNYMENNPDAFEEAIVPLIAPAYDDTAAYKVGNLLTYLGKQYYCITDAPAGTLPTNTTYFEEKSVADIIEMIKQGAIVTGHSAVADNLTPYSEDSGTTQENPFISQGTGTDNNSVIVTTGNIARQLEKQGYTIPVMQVIDSSKFPESDADFIDGVKFTKNADNTITITVDAGGATADRYYSLYRTDGGTGNTGALTIPAQHKLTAGVGYATGVSLINKYNNQVYSNAVTTNTNGNTEAFRPCLKVESGTVAGTYKVNPYLFDITSWDADIITDLTSTPSHFSWYYNGSLAYDAGSLQNCNGRYLECGQGRQLWDEEWEQGAYNLDTGKKQTSAQQIRNKTPFIVIANRPVYAYVQGGSSTIRVSQLYFYDANMTFISRTALANNGASAIAPAGAVFVNFQTSTSYGGTYNKPITISLYYSPEEGGEGYDQYYPYIAPIRIDTGNETLKAFDKKLPSGVIGYNTEKIVLDGVTSGRKITSVSVHAGTGLYYGALTIPQTGVQTTSAQNTIVCDKFVNAPTAGAGVCYITSSGNSMIFFNTDQTLQTVEAWNTWLTTHNVTVEYLLAEANRTTEQSTPYSEYADINDYSYMAWFDTDGNLVSIPQGCKLFYPVDYKGFLDDGVMYTDGDFTSLAKNESITDSALNARGYYKMQDLSSGITDLAGLTYGIKRLTLCGNVATLTIRAENKTGSEIASNTWLFSLPSSVTIGATTLGLVGLVSGSVSNLALNGSENKVFATTALANDGVVHIAVSFIVA